MKAREFISMLNGLDHHIRKFNIKKMLKKIKNKDLNDEQVQKLKQDVWNLEEDLIMIDCEQ
jgi:hypothetical protein